MQKLSHLSPPKFKLDKCQKAKKVLKNHQVLKVKKLMAKSIENEELDEDDLDESHDSDDSKIGDD